MYEAINRIMIYYVRGYMTSSVNALLHRTDSG